MAMATTLHSAPSFLLIANTAFSLSSRSGYINLSYPVTGILNLPFVTVTIKKGQVPVATANTGPGGSFTLAQIPAGDDYTLEVAGFVPFGPFTVTAPLNLGTVTLVGL